MRIEKSPLNHSTLYMTNEENKMIGKTIDIGHLHLKITSVTYLKHFDTWGIGVYESWGSDHAPMTTCGHNMGLKRKSNGSWTFSGDEYYDKYITEDVVKLLDEIISFGGLVIDTNFSATWVVAPRSLAFPE